MQWDKVVILKLTLIFCISSSLLRDFVTLFVHVDLSGGTEFEESMFLLVPPPRMKLFYITSSYCSKTLVNPSYPLRSSN